MYIMDQRQILSAFNDHFMEFVDDVQLVFPNNDDIATVKTSLVSFRKANPRLILLAFKDSVIGRYRNEITKGDLNFFIDRKFNFIVWICKPKDEHIEIWHFIKFII